MASNVSRGPLCIISYQGYTDEGQAGRSQAGVFTVDAEALQEGA